MLTVDEAALKAEIREAVRQYQSTFERIEAHAQSLFPYYREMYRRAASRDVGMSRWLSDEG